MTSLTPFTRRVLGLKVRHVPCEVGLHHLGSALCALRSEGLEQPQDSGLRARTSMAFSLMLKIFSGDMQ